MIRCSRSIAATAISMAVKTQRRDQLRLGPNVEPDRDEQARGQRLDHRVADGDPARGTIGSGRAARARRRPACCRRAAISGRSCGQRDRGLDERLPPRQPVGDHVEEAADRGAEDAQQAKSAHRCDDGHQAIGRPAAALTCTRGTASHATQKGRARQDSPLAHSQFRDSRDVLAYQVPAGLRPSSRPCRR